VVSVMASRILGRALQSTRGTQLLTGTSSDSKLLRSDCNCRMLRSAVEERRKGLRSVLPSSYALAMSSSVSSILAIATRNRRTCAGRGQLVRRISPAF